MQREHVESKLLVAAAFELARSLEINRLLGAAAVFDKPFDLQRLHSTIEGLFSHA